MKLVVIGPVYPYRGGIAHYTMALIQALVTRGHQVLTISFRRQYPKWLFPGASDRDPSQRPLNRVEAEYLLDSLWPPSWGRVLGRIVRAEPEALIVPWWTTYWAPIWITITAGVRLLSRRTRIVYICHNVLPHERRPGDCWLTRMTLRWGDYFIVQSDEERERLVSLLPFSGTEVESRVAIVPHPVYEYSEYRRSSISREEARDCLEVADDFIMLLAFGIVRPYKGIEDLIRALPLVVEREPRVRLFIVGEFWEPVSKYEALISKLGLQEYVFVENRYVPDEELPYYFKAADYFVAAHRAVTGSASVQLARSFGVPIIDRLAWGERARSPEGLAECILASLRRDPANGVTVEVEQPTWNDLVARIERSVRGG